MKTLNSFYIIVLDTNHCNILIHIPSCYRGLNHLELPDHHQNGVTFYKGQVKGITNLSRKGDAKLEASTDHILIIFTLQAKNIEAEYFWKKTRLK